MEFIILKLGESDCENYPEKSISLFDTKDDEAILDASINHPSHYTQGEYEVIDVIEDWNLGFHLGNAIKYIARANHKGSRKQDLRKAIWYIEREIERDKK